MRRVRALAAIVAAGVIAASLLSGPLIWDRVQLATGWGLPQRQGDPMLIIAHSGDGDRYPENTLDGILAAAALHPDGIEFDVQRSASGTWFVMHDPTLDRTTDGSGEIADLTDDAIEAATIDGGLGFDLARHVGLKVPRLDEVLAGLRPFGGLIMIDMQHASAGDPVELLEASRGLDVAIICRTQADAVAIKRADDSVQTLLLAATGEGSDAIDGWLIEAVNLPSTSRLGTDLPITTFVGQERFNEDEYPYLRRAWSIGVRAFLSRHLSEALKARDALAGDG